MPNYSYSAMQPVYDKVVEALDNIDPVGDPEVAHSTADDLLLACVPHEVADAYQRLVQRSPWWACA